MAKAVYIYLCMCVHVCSYAYLWTPFVEVCMSMQTPHSSNTDKWNLAVVQLVSLMYLYYHYVQCSVYNKNAH